MGTNEVVKCSCCGKMVYYFELGSSSDNICYDCTEKMNNSLWYRKWYYFKRFVKRIISFILFYLSLIVIGIVSIALLVFWVGGCVGSALNVDEDPAPTLHWKPDK